MDAEAPPRNGARDGEAKVLTIIEHLRELRGRVIVSVLAVVVGIGVSIWPLTTYAFHYLVVPAQQQVPGLKLHQFALLDYWNMYFRVSLLLGFSLAMPVIIYEILAFVAPGLTRTERRWLLGVVGAASVMFLLGMVFAYYVELPRLLDFMLNSDSPDVQPTIGVTTYISTVTRILLLTGLLFETPLVIMALAKAGLITSRRLIKWWRYAVVASVVLASFLAPSLNPLTPIMVGIPILGLYFLGALLARLVEGNALLRPRAPDRGG